MNIGIFIAKRLMRHAPVQSKGKASGFSKLIVNLAMSAVAVSIVVMILAVAIVKGYQKEVKDKIIGFHAPLQISHLAVNNSFESYPINRDSVLEMEVPKLDGVTYVQRYGTKAGIIKTEEAFEGIVLKGVDESYRWDFFNRNLVEGKVPDWQKDQPQNELFISLETAKKLQVKVGTEVLVYFIQEPPRVRKLKICGIFDTGLGDLDQLYAFTDIRHVQKLNGWNHYQISGYEIGIANLAEVEYMRENVAVLTPYNMGLSTITELYPSLFEWLALLDMNVVIILSLMVVVAAINMITALLILILERLQMIGLMKALGSSNKQIASVFLWMAARIIGIGLFWGNLIGLGFAIAQKELGFIRLDPNAYYLNKVPIAIYPVDLLWINFLAFVICLLLLLLPVRVIAKISPAKTIKFN
jgi:lipoprotein-releasing system permease protein